MRKVYLLVSMKMIVRLDDGADLGEFMADMDYTLTTESDAGDIEEFEIRDYAIQDSK